MSCFARKSGKVVHPVSDRTQPCLTSAKLMELAGPLGHSPRKIDLAEIFWTLGNSVGLRSDFNFPSKHFLKTCLFKCSEGAIHYFEKLGEFILVLALIMIIYLTRSYLVFRPYILVCHV